MIFLGRKYFLSFYSFPSGWSIFSFYASKMSENSILEASLARLAVHFLLPKYIIRLRCYIKALLVNLHKMKVLFFFSLFHNIFSPLSFAEYQKQNCCETDRRLLCPGGRSQNKKTGHQVSTRILSTKRCGKYLNQNFENATCSHPRKLRSSRLNARENNFVDIN